MSEMDLGQVRTPSTGTRSAGVPVQLAGALEVRLVRDQEVDYLLLSSRLDPHQSLLLPAGGGQPLQGLAQFTRMGRWHAVPWALVWAPGLPPDCPVHFSSGDLRFRRDVPVAAVALGPVWVAAVEGVFRFAHVPAGPQEERTVLLGRHW